VGEGGKLEKLEIGIRDMEKEGGRRKRE